MNKLVTTTLFCTLAISGCANLSEQRTPEPIAETKETPARSQLHQFAKLIEHMNQATSADGAKAPDTEKLNHIITRLDGPLQTLESSADESEKVRQMLAAADEISGNRNELFSGLFVLFSQLVSSK